MIAFIIATFSRDGVDDIGVASLMTDGFRLG